MSETVPLPSSSAPLRIESGRAGRSARRLSRMWLYLDRFLGRLGALGAVGAHRADDGVVGADGIVLDGDAAEADVIVVRGERDVLALELGVGAGEHADDVACGVGRGVRRTDTAVPPPRWPARPGVSVPRLERRRADRRPSGVTRNSGGRALLGGGTSTISDPAHLVASDFGIEQVELGDHHGGGVVPARVGDQRKGANVAARRCRCRRSARRPCPSPARR